MVAIDTTLAALNAYLKKPLTVDTLEHVLFDLGFELDSKDPLALKVEVTADRPDMISTAGVARVLNAYLDYASGMPRVERKPSMYELMVDKSVLPVRAFTAAMVVKGLRLDAAKLEELIYVQEKIHATFARDRKKAAIGIYPFKKIQWPITFQGIPPADIKFPPLGEAALQDAKTILETHAAGKKYGHLLAGLPLYPVFKDHAGHVLSMPPIINSHTVGQVTTADTDLFVEVSGHYWPTVSAILDILAFLFADMKGEIHEVKVHYPNENAPRVTPELGIISKTLDLKTVNEALGTDFTTAQVSLLLGRMLYSTKKSNPSQLVVETPAFRVDILHEMDVVDDVARAYGFKNLAPESVNVYTRGGILPHTQFTDDARLACVGLGFQEILSWALTSAEHHFAAFEREETPHVKLGVVKEQGLTMVRNMLYPETLRALLANRSKRLPFKLFELDHVVEMDKSADTGTRTRTKLCLVLGHASASFDEMKGNVEALATQLGFSADFSASEEKGFISGRVARVKMGSHAGFLGELHPRVLSRLGISFPVLIFECALD